LIEGRRKKEEGRRKKFSFSGRTWERISLLLCLVIFKRRQSKSEIHSLAEPRNEIMRAETRDF
jgi:hypothetical protein